MKKILYKGTVKALSPCLVTIDGLTLESEVTVYGTTYDNTTYKSKKTYKSKEKLEEALADIRKFLKEEIIYDDGNDLAIIREKSNLLGGKVNDKDD